MIYYKVKNNVLKLHVQHKPTFIENIYARLVLFLPYVFGW